MKTEQYLKRALRGFREDNQTLEQFLAVLIGLKRIDEPASATSLLAVLRTENAANPLPSEIYDGVSRWIKMNSDLSEPTSNHKSNVVNIPSPKHPANLNREFRKHKARILNNRYVLVKVIDSSFIGTVYKAIDLRKQEADIPEPYVAIKILKRTFRAHQDWLTTYYNEVQKRQWLTHPNITKVLGLDRDASTVFIIMEYILGESLAHALNFDDLRKNLIQKGHLLPTINGMGEALAFAHKRGIIHGNFKPSKVLLTKDDEVKVFDFSIECALSDIDAADPTLEMESPLVETRIYASPEVLEYKAPDPRDDVYALASTTYELLTGLHPFNREISTVARNAGMKAKFHSGMDRRQWKALRHALAFDRDKRTANVTQFLAEFSGSHPVTSKPWLRYVAGIAAVTVTAGVALNYHFSKLEQVQVAQQESEDKPRLSPIPEGPESTPAPTAHVDVSDTGNITPEELIEINAALESLTSDELIASNTYHDTGEASPPSMEHLERESLPQGGEQLIDESFIPPSSVMIETTQLADTPDDEATETDAPDIENKEANAPDVETSEYLQNNEITAASTQTASLIDPVPAEEQASRTSQDLTAIAHQTNSLESNKQEKISELMSQAEQQSDQRQLTVPAGANALETYREVLALNSEYEPARKGIEDIKQRFKTLSQKTQEQGELTRAKTQLQKAMAVDPDDTSLKEDLAVLQKALKADQAARAVSQKVNTLLEKTQQQLAGQRLTQPPGNNAWESLNEIIQIDPANKKAQKGLDALAGELESKAIAKQQAGDLDAALAFADEGLRVRSNDPELRALHSELSYQAELKSKALLEEKQSMDSSMVENGATDSHAMPPQQAIEETKPRRFRAGGTF